MLMAIYFKATNEYMYVTKDEYYEVAEALNYLGADFVVYTIEERMYKITVFDDIDEEWIDLWCKEEEYEEQMKLIREADVEYTVEQYN